MPVTTSAYGDEIRQLCAPVSNATVYRTTAGNYKNSNWIHSLTNTHPFIYDVSVIFPCKHDTPLMRDILSQFNHNIQNFPVFIIKNVYLASIASEPVSRYLFETYNCGLISPAKPEGIPRDDNLISILPTGELFLRINTNTYQRMGLAFPTEKTNKINDYKTIKIPLRDKNSFLKQTKTHSKDDINGAYKRVLWALGEEQTTPIDLVGYFNYPIQNNLRNYFMAELLKLLNLHGSCDSTITFEDIEIHIDQYTGGKYTTAQYHDIFSIQHDQYIPSLNADKIHGILSNTIQNKEDQCCKEYIATELLEFMGHILLDIPIDPSDFDICYPTNDTQSVEELTRITFTNPLNLLGSGIITNIIGTISNMVKLYKESFWCLGQISGVESIATAWGDKSHEIDMSGENVDLILLSNNTKQTDTLPTINEHIQDLIDVSNQGDTSSNVRL